MWKYTLICAAEDNDGVCHATISNWVRAYREECQTNNAVKSEYELMQENRKLRQEIAEAKIKTTF